MATKETKFADLEKTLVSTGKAKGIIKNHSALKALDGDKNDSVVSIEIPKVATPAEEIVSATVCVGSIFANMLMSDKGDTFRNDCKTHDVSIAVDGELVTLSGPFKSYVDSCMKVLTDWYTEFYKTGVLHDMAGADVDVDQDGNVKIVAPIKKETRRAQRLIRAVTGNSLNYITDDEKSDMKTPYVIIAGKIVEPVWAGIKLINGRLSTPGGSAFSEDSVYINYWGTDVESLVFSVYKVNIGGRDITLVLDEKSTMDVSSQFLGSDSYDDGVSNSRKAVVTLIDTSSKEDTFYGEVTLVGIESSRNTYQNSTINKLDTASVRSESNPWQAGLPWESVLRENRNFRHVYKRSLFKQTQIESSTLAPGIYKDARISNSTIKSDAHVLVKQCDITKSEIKGKTIILERFKARHVRITIDGDVHIAHTVMKDEHPTAPSLFLPNKFCTLDIPLPYGSLRMYRESKDKFTLCLNSYTSVTMPLANEFFDINTLVKELIAKGNDGYRQLGINVDSDDPIARSLLRSIVDTILSRFKVIKMLDSATALVDTLTQREPEEQHYLTPF